MIFGHPISDEFHVRFVPVRTSVALTMVRTVFEKSDSF